MHAGSIVARDDMMKELWEYDFWLMTIVCRGLGLRKKLEEAGLSNFIETQESTGYGLAHEQI